MKKTKTEMKEKQVWMRNESPMWFKLNQYKAPVKLGWTKYRNAVSQRGDLKVDVGGDEYEQRPDLWAAVTLYLITQESGVNGLFEIFCMFFNGNIYQILVLVWKDRGYYSESSEILLTSTCDDTSPRQLQQLCKFSPYCLLSFRGLSCLS